MNGVIDSRLWGYIFLKIDLTPCNAVKPQIQKQDTGCGRIMYNQKYFY